MKTDNGTCGFLTQTLATPTTGQNETDELLASFPYGSNLLANQPHPDDWFDPGKIAASWGLPA